MLENLETEALMQEWGLNERAFQSSPRTNSGAFGSPVYVSPERPPELPPLGEGLDSFLKTKSGGFLRSMNPSLFGSAKNGERLIMQASRCVVLPAAMGFNGRDLLQKWAIVGAEKMLSQATQLMPIDEITGKTLQQMAWEAEFKSEMELLERGPELLCESKVNDNLYMRKDEAKEMARDIGCEIDSEYVSLGNITHLATEKIQHLIIEGLRIQSGMSNEEPTSSIHVQCLRETLASTSNRVKGPPSNILRNLDDFDELIGLSISLEEWMRLDSASFDDKCEVSDRDSKIFAAHCAKTDMSTVNKFGKLSDQNHGNFGNSFMLALRMLLRDPLRDYEPVGIPMLILIQVERTHDSGYPMFRISEVYVTGFKADPGKKQQSGSRWLQSSGMMGKTKTHPFSKSNALVRSSSQWISKVKHEDILWSISSYVHGAVATTLHVRNPDIIFKWGH